MNLVLSHLLPILFPATCVACRMDLRPSESPLCQACLSQVRFCTGALSSPRPFESLYTAFEFEGRARDLLHAYKYQGKDYLTSLLVNLWTRGWAKPSVDFIVPVPMSYWREIKRGYNQSELLAQELGKRWGKPVLARALGRRWGLPTQTNLNRADRKRNAEAGFCLRSPVETFQNKKILLVDDVYTTGATLQTCARLLKKAGAETLYGSTLAREGKKGLN